LGSFGKNTLSYRESPLPTPLWVGRGGPPRRPRCSHGSASRVPCSPATWCSVRSLAHPGGRCSVRAERERASATEPHTALSFSKNRTYHTTPGSPRLAIISIADNHRNPLL
jgi:hypothetical protein